MFSIIYWGVTLGFLLVGTTTAWMTLTHLWNKHDRFVVAVLSQLRMGHPLPGDNNYLDLKFSLTRHAFMFIVSAAVMYWVRSRFISNVCYWGYGLYTVSVVLRYLNRKDYIKNLATSAEARELVDLLTKPLKDSRVVLIYSVCASIITIILYAIRP